MNVSYLRLPFLSVLRGSSKSRTANIPSRLLSRRSTSGPRPAGERIRSLPRMRAAAQPLRSAPPRYVPSNLARTATGGSFSKWERGGAAQASEGARETFRWLWCRRRERRPREPSLMDAKTRCLLGALPRKDCVKGVNPGSTDRGLEIWRPASGRRSR